MKQLILKNHEIGKLYFGQLHPYHTEYFNDLSLRKNRIQLYELPHFTTLYQEDTKNEETDYYRYLSISWKYYNPSNNTHESRVKRLNEYRNLYKSIKKSGVTEPVKCVYGPDKALIIIDGNHRASVAYRLGIDLPIYIISKEQYIKEVVDNPEEFYGSKNNKIQYQSVFYGSQEIIPGRRRDIYERFNKMDILNDIRGNSVLDLGCNIGVTGLLSSYFGAKSVTGIEFSPRIASAALRLSALFAAGVDIRVGDLSKNLHSEIKQSFDTVFCFSVFAHVADKNGLIENIINLTEKTLYYEGHEHTAKKDYKELFSKFKKVELIGYNDDGIHSKEKTRPFFKCTK